MSEVQVNEVQSFIPQPVIFTDSAARKVKELMDEEGNPNLGLRVFITGGGCSGFQYGFAFEEEVAEDDLIIEKVAEDEGSGTGSNTGAQTVRLLIDPMSLTYLTGAEIDYREDIEGARFIIRNPNAKTTCGCGSSFNA